MLVARGEVVAVLVARLVGVAVRATVAVPVCRVPGATSTVGLDSAVRAVGVGDGVRMGVGCAAG